jgi:glycerol-3-phosphate dehydrogenase
MAITIRDVLARRWRLELLDWRLTNELVPIVAELMGAELNWSPEEQERYVGQYQALLATFIREAGLTTKLVTA